MSQGVGRGPPLPAVVYSFGFPDNVTYDGSRSMNVCQPPLSKAALAGVVVALLGGGCSVLPRFSSAKAPGNHAFIVYWPPAKDSGKLRLAVKDNIDVKGVVTSAGSEYFAKHHPPAAKDAACLAIARRRNVAFVGKTNLSEFAAAPSGCNDYFGTPKNPLTKDKLIPGGSSCGSAIAVATGMADVALGTDTAGSIRIPAACCGVVGLKTTHALISLDGVFPIEPEHLDTVGPLAKDIEHAALGMDLLQEGFADRYAAAKAARPTGDRIRVGRLILEGTDPKIEEAVDEALAKAGFQIVLLGDNFKKKWEDATADGSAVAAAGTWMSGKEYRFKPGVSGRTKSIILVGQIDYITKYDNPVARQAAWQRVLRKMFEQVDIIALPTLKSTPPRMGLSFSPGLFEKKVLNLANTVAINFSGNPALAMPIPLRRGNVPVTSLQLIGPRKSEAELLNAGRLVELANQR